MIKKVSHIGIGVENLEEAREFFQENFQLSSSTPETFGELQFCFVPMDGTQLELLQSTQTDGQIAKFIRNKGAGIHHIAFEVDDIQKELNRLQENGLQLINREPYRNAHQELVAFIHPKSTHGVLVELIQTHPE